MKLLVSDIMSFFAHLGYGSKVFDYKHVMPDLKKDGVVVIENFLSSNESHILKEEVLLAHKKYADRLKIYEEGCDSRFFGIDNYMPSNSDFLAPDFCIDLCNAVQGLKSWNKVTMSNYLTPTKDNSGSGGGWHRDSPFSNQFKSFLFLSDVDYNNGPLSIIKGSHLRENIKKFSKVLGTKTSQYRFSDDEVEKAIKLLGWRETMLTCHAGTLVFANTRALHRGTPIRSGNRIALTNYYFKKEIPKHFGVMVN